LNRIDDQFSIHCTEDFLRGLAVATPARANRSVDFNRQEVRLPGSEQPKQSKPAEDRPPGNMLHGIQTAA
jgi:hypothetical protein